MGFTGRLCEIMEHFNISSTFFPQKYYTWIPNLDFPQHRFLQCFHKPCPPSLTCHLPAQDSRKCASEHTKCIQNLLHVHLTGWKWSLTLCFVNVLTVLIGSANNLLDQYQIYKWLCYDHIQYWHDILKVQRHSETLYAI